MAQRNYPARRNSQGNLPEATSSDSPTWSERLAAWSEFLRRNQWLLAVALAAATLAAYWPARSGGFIWDDDAHVTRHELQSWEGLYRIWFDVGATLQYYPILHSTFWIEHRLWGDATLGYHLVNLFWHVTAAILAAIILRRLKVPGAYLVAAIFALHPINVETVAWITEQKNTLSAVFYLTAMLTYLKFDETRQSSRHTPCAVAWRWYFAALGLFALAVMTKTVTATLPGALLVIFWWQRGTLSWKKDAVPLLPFFVFGAAGGMITAWWELRMNNCVGPIFAFTFVERILIAGRVTWFCIGKLFWPTDLTFIYPRWHIDSHVWWQYAFPIAAFALLVAFWAIRRRTRAPLAAMLYFGGTMFPVLGFFNLYTYRFSLVADHYQYLAGLGIITLAVSAGAWLIERGGPWRRPAAYALSLGLLSLLAGLTFQQSRIYADVTTLYTNTIAANPECWLAHGNLGQVYDSEGRTEDAIAEYRKALDIEPDCFEARNNLGYIYARHGQFDAAIVEYRKALKIDLDPLKTARIHINLGQALAGSGQREESIEEFQEALRLTPRDVEARVSLGNVLRSLGRSPEAIAQYRELLNYPLLPRDLAMAHNTIGEMLAARGQTGEALEEFRAAMKLVPNIAQGQADLAVLTQSHLGAALAELGHYDEAIVEYRAALEVQPNLDGVRRGLDRAVLAREKTLSSLASQRTWLHEHPDDTARLNDLAWSLATNPNASARNGKEAVELAERAAKLTGGQQPAILDTLAAAYAEAGQFSEAVKTAEKAIELAKQEKNASLAAAISKRLEGYQSRYAFRKK